MPNAMPSTSLADRFHIPKNQRWVNFEAYEMKLKLAVYKDGYMLVVENGDPHSSKLAELGFRKIGDEWASFDIFFLPSEFIETFPEATLTRGMLAEDIVVDRTSIAMPPKADVSKSKRSISERIASAAKEAPTAVPGLKVWFADVDLGDHTIHGFGSSPEQAMRSLVEVWSRHAAREHANVSLLTEYRGSISVNPAELGQGYAIGIGDSGWYQGGYNGSDERFDDILANVPSTSQTSRPRP